MIIIVCLLHSKQRGALSFSESGRHGSHGCAVGELCVCCLGNQPTDSSRLLRTGCCCWRLISLLNSRADPWGEKLGLLKSVAKSCSFYLSQDFSLDLFVPEWAEEKVLSFLSAFFLEHRLRRCRVLVAQKPRKVLEILPCPEAAVLGTAGAGVLGLSVSPTHDTGHANINTVAGLHPPGLKSISMT